MIQLSLADINQKSPYQVVKAPNGDFFFATSLDIHYLISFEEEEPLGQCDTYQFVIQKLDMQRSPHDPKVEQTILAIINQFFIEHLMFFYICAMIATDARPTAIGCSSVGSRSTLSPIGSPFAVLMPPLREKAFMLPLLLRTGIPCSKP